MWVLKMKEEESLATYLVSLHPFAPLVRALAADEKALRALFSPPSHQNSARSVLPRLSRLRSLRLPTRIQLASSLLRLSRLGFLRVQPAVPAGDKDVRPSQLQLLKEKTAKTCCWGERWLLRLELARDRRSILAV